MLPSSKCWRETAALQKCHSIWHATGEYRRFEIIRSCALLHVSVLQPSVAHAQHSPQAACVSAPTPFSQLSVLPRCFPTSRIRKSSIMGAHHDRETRESRRGVLMRESAHALLNIIGSRSSEAQGVPIFFQLHDARLSVRISIPPVQSLFATTSRLMIERPLVIHLLEC